MPYSTCMHFSRPSASGLVGLVRTSLRAAPPGKYRYRLVFIIPWQWRQQHKFGAPPCRSYPTTPNRSRPLFPRPGDKEHRKHTSATHETRSARWYPSTRAANWRAAALAGCKCAPPCACRPSPDLERPKRDLVIRSKAVRRADPRSLTALDSEGEADPWARWSEEANYPINCGNNLACRNSSLLSL